MTSSAPTAPHLVVVILHWGAPETTARCLRSLREASWPGRPTVLIVDNSGCLDEDSAEAARPLSVEIIRLERNLGFCDGCTLGMTLAMEKGADWVLLLNNDVVVAPNFIDPLLTAARGIEDAGLLSPQILHLDRPETAWYRGGAFSLWTGIPVQGHRRRAVPVDRPLQDVDYATGCAMLIRLDVIRRIGSFDAQFFAYCEDLDLSIRARRAGFRVLFVPESVVYHDAAEPHRGSLRVYYSTRNLLEVMRKHAAWYRWFTFGANFIVRWVGFFAILALVRGQPRQLMALAKGMMDFSRRRFGQSGWVDDARARPTATCLQALTPTVVLIHTLGPPV